MWEMFWQSAQLFLKGKLFRDPLRVVRQGAVGVAIGVILLVVLAKAGLPAWAAAMVAGLVTGAAQPFLFKNLKYS
jgi:hypothetical protein